MLFFNISNRRTRADHHRKTMNSTEGRSNERSPRGSPWCGLLHYHNLLIELLSCSASKCLLSPPIYYLILLIKMLYLSFCILPLDILGRLLVKNTVFRNSGSSAPSHICDREGLTGLTGRLEQYSIKLRQLPEGSKPTISSKP